MSMFILRYKKKKIETKMDPIFEHPVFDSFRNKMKRFIKQLEKSKETSENLLYTCFIPVVYLYTMWEQQYIFCCKTD